MATAEIGNAALFMVSFGPGKAGLTHVGYTLVNPNGSNFSPRSEVGVIELGGGDYYVGMQFDQEWQGFILWDTGEISPKTAREAVEILPKPTLVPPTPTAIPAAGFVGTGTVPDFIKLLTKHGSDARYRRNGVGALVCPCRTVEGFRDPRFHLELPNYGPKNGIVSPTPGGISGLHNVAYRFVAVGVDGGTASPSILSPTLTGLSGQSWSVDFPTVLIPPRGTVAGWNAYRSDDGGPFKSVGFFNSDNFHDQVPIPNISTDVLVEPRLCNEEGLIPVAPVDTYVKAFVQPIQSTRATRLNIEIVTQMFGEVQADDHLGIFPIQWGGFTLDFQNWSQSGDEYVFYDGQYFLVINSNKIADPANGNPNHHWEVGLRLISTPIAAVP